MKYMYYKNDVLIYCTNNAIDSYKFEMVNECKVNNIIVKCNYIITFYSNGIILHINKDMI